MKAREKRKRKLILTLLDQLCKLLDRDGELSIQELALFDQMMKHDPTLKRDPKLHDKLKEIRSDTAAVIEKLDDVFSDRFDKPAKVVDEVQEKAPEQQQGWIF